MSFINNGPGRVCVHLIQNIIIIIFISIGVIKMYHYYHYQYYRYHYQCQYHYLYSYYLKTLVMTMTPLCSEQTLFRKQSSFFIKCTIKRWKNRKLSNSPKF